MPSQNAAMGLAQALNRVRTGANRTQEDIAGALEIRQPTVSKWENPRAEGSPSIDQIAEFEDYCGVARGTVYRLMGYAETVTPEAAIQADPRLTAEQVHLALRFYASLISEPSDAKK